MRKTLSLLAIIAALSSSALAASSASFSGGEIVGNNYRGTYGKVTISDGPETPVTYVYGCFSNEGSVVGCSVTMDGGTIGGSVNGAYSTVGCADWGTVTIRGGEVNGNIYGGTSSAAADHANYNTVTISGGTVAKQVTGGFATSEASSNTVTISGGEVQGSVTGGISTAVKATNNTVTISGGAVNGKVYGGYSYTGDANGNTVTISGGTVTGDVYGGKTDRFSATQDTINNTVNLVGEGATLGELTGSSFMIEGSVLGGNGDSITNNTLNVYGKGITVGGAIFLFETANFYLAPNIQNGDTLLTSTSFYAENVKVKCDGDTLLNDGDKVTLVHATVGAAGCGTSSVDIIKGVTASYSGKVAKVGTDLVLTVGDDSPTPVPTPKVETNTLKSMTETRTDVAALVNAAADFMSTTGMQQAKMAAKAAAKAGQDGGAAPFVALGGSHLRYNTGSHVDSNGFNGALGVAKTVSPSVTLGVAGEYGTSDYKSYVGGVRGNGDSKLYGGAILADWQGKQGWHAESSVRLGRSHTDYSAMTPLGYTNYSDKASYQSVSIGGGKEFKVSSKSNNTVDVYARYMYGHTNGSNAKASSGESIHFAGVNSHRTLVGARYNYELCDSATLYAGAAWMHEFDGDAHSVIGGFTSPSPSLKGNSGMVELGTTFAPCASDRVLLNLNVQGWTGVQRGISGGAGCTIKF